MSKKYILFFIIFSLVGCVHSSKNQLEQTIHAYTRDSSSGTKIAFEKAIHMSGKLSDSAIEVSSNGNMIESITRDKEGLGYVSYNEQLEQEDVEILKVNGIAPSKASILDGSYPLYRDFYLVTRAIDDFASNDQQEIVNAFCDYLLNSEEAYLYLNRFGLIRNSEQKDSWNDIVKRHPILQKQVAVEISVVGSTSAEPSMQEIMLLFNAHVPNVRFIFNFGGSSDAFKRVLGDEKNSINKADIGFSSRPFNDDEPVDQAMFADKYCKDAIAIIINKENTEQYDITISKLFALYTLDALTWENLK